VSVIPCPGWARTVNGQPTSERPATRADLRAISWLMLRSLASDPGAVQWALAHLAVLDADERDDAWAVAFVAARLKGTIVVTNLEGRVVGLRSRQPERVP
jgi:hypothetical protein